MGNLRIGVLGRVLRFALSAKRTRRAGRLDSRRDSFMVIIIHYPVNTYRFSRSGDCPRTWASRGSFSNASRDETNPTCEAPETAPGWRLRLVVLSVVGLAPPRGVRDPGELDATTVAASRASHSRTWHQSYFHALGQVDRPC